MIESIFIGIITTINIAILISNIIILGLAVKLYSEATKTHIFTKKESRGI